LGLLFVLSAAVGVIFGLAVESLPQMHAAMIGLIAGISIFLVYSMIVGRGFSKSVAKSAATSALGKALTLSIDSSGYSIDGELHRQRTSWSAVTTVTENDKHIILWIGPSGLIVPKRVFAHEAAVRNFSSFVAGQIELSRNSSPSVAKA